MVVFFCLFNCGVFLISIRLIVKIKWQKASFQIIQRSFAEEIYFATLNCFFSFFFHCKLLWEELLLTKKKRLRLTDNALLWMVKHYESLIFN